MRSSHIQNKAITIQKIRNASVSAAKIRDNAVTTEKIRNSAVTTSKIAQNTIQLADLAQSLRELLIPAGTIMPFAGSSENTPSGWLVCDGAPVSKNDFPTLFSAIGSAWGGDGAPNFNLPDLRGRFLRGVDSGQGRDPDSGSRSASSTGGNEGDLVGTLQGMRTNNIDEIQTRVTQNTAQPATVTVPNNGSHSPFVSTTEAPGIGSASSWEIRARKSGNETRPVNAYVTYIIKY